MEIVSQQREKTQGNAFAETEDSWMSSAIY